MRDVGVVDGPPDQGILHTKSAGFCIDDMISLMKDIRKSKGKIFQHSVGRV
jgi:hypothetical protein